MSPILAPSTLTTSGTEAMIRSATPARPRMAISRRWATTKSIRTTRCQKRSAEALMLISATITIRTLESGWSAPAGTGSTRPLPGPSTVTATLTSAIRPGSSAAAPLVENHHSEGDRGIHPPEVPAEIGADQKINLWQTEGGIIRRPLCRECNCVRLVNSGGNWNNTSNAGSFYRNCNDDFGNSNWNIGGRPPLSETHLGIIESLSF